MIEKIRMEERLSMDGVLKTSGFRWTEEKTIGQARKFHGNVPGTG